MDKPIETRALALPKITPFERRMLHLGADPATIYSPEDLEIYYAIKAQEDGDAEWIDPNTQTYDRYVRYERIKAQEEKDRAGN